MPMSKAGNRRNAVAVVSIAIVTALAFLIAIWFGEENRQARGLAWLLYRGGLAGLFAAASAFVVGIPVSVYLLSRRGSLSQPMVVAAFTSCAIFASAAGGFAVGDRSRSRATNQCFTQGEEIRRALDRYRAVHGSYPRLLSQLPGIRLPGQRLLRGSVLEYERTSNGYNLVVEDPIMITSATETHGFVSTK